METSSEITIGIIDDDEIFQFLLGKLIRRISDKINIITMNNGEDAIAYFKSIDNGPSVLFVDLNMPIMNGWEFLDWYENNFLSNAATKVFVLTSSIFQSDEERSKMYKSVRGFLSKPLEEEELRKILE